MAASALGCYGLSALLCILHVYANATGSASELPLLLGRFLAELSKT